MDNLTKCEKCIHEEICGLKDGYLRNVVELTRYPAEQQTIVMARCRYFNPRFLTSRDLREPPVVTNKEISTDFRDRESFPK